MDPAVEAAKRFEQLWKAAFNTALEFPIEDYAASDGYIESAWIYKTPKERYRFFIYVLREKENPLDIEVQSQTRSSTVSGQKHRWRWNAPTLDIEEKLKKAIYGAAAQNSSS